MAGRFPGCLEYMLKWQKKFGVDGKLKDDQWKEVVVKLEGSVVGEEEAKGPSSLDVIEILKNVGIVESTDIGLKNVQRKNKIIIGEEEEAEEGLTSD